MPSTVSKVSFGSQIKTLPALNIATITEVTISSDNLNFTVEGNCIYNKEKTILNAVWGLPTKINILKGVQTIGINAMKGQTKLISVQLPDTVEKIEGSAFYQCSSLTSVSLGSHLKQIGDSIFRDCSSLTSIEIPSSIESIDGSAFWDWPQAKTIYIHKKKDEIAGAPWGANLGDRAIIWDE